jgi:Kef-type K+ transport system membrane component KefB
MVPLFFATMGSLVDVRVFLRPEILWLALLITLLAIATKFVGCGLAALPLGRRDALVIGIGMIPRGEVGFVIALVGLRLKVITPDLYGVVVVMCLLTTLLAPPLLWRMLSRRGRGEEAAPGRLAPFATQDSRELASSEHEISPGDIQDDA